ncbi:MAG: HD domain-containing protein [Anaerolineae bacterium]|nr:HD domain-containing protein [Anaerolineae bacterium]
MTGDGGYSELYERALRIAAGSHRRQNRKGSAIPYITHPVHVSLILLRYGFPMEVCIAGLLHDVVEDQNYTLAAIDKDFGPRVAHIVGALSETKSDGRGNKLPWEIRKADGLAKVRQAGQEAAAVKAADTIHNINSTLYDIRASGVAVLDRFNRGPQQMLANYRKIVALVDKAIGPHPLADELAAATVDLGEVVDRICRAAG